MEFLEKTTEKTQDHVFLFTLLKNKNKENNNHCKYHWAQNIFCWQIDANIWVKPGIKPPTLRPGLAIITRSDAFQCYKHP